MPRLIFVNRFFHPDLSATSQMLHDLASRLAATGCDVTVVCSRQRYDDPQEALPACEIVDGIQVRRVWTTRFGRNSLSGRALDYASFYFSAALMLLRTVARDDLVIVKTDPPLMSVLAGVVARLRGAKMVNWLQDVFPEVASRLGADPLPEAVHRMLRAARDRSLKRAVVNVVLGTRMRDYFLGRGIPAEKLLVIENWADESVVTVRDPGESELRRRLNAGDALVVGYSGNLGRAHDIEALLAAAVILRDERDIVFLMIGGGHKMRELQGRVTDLGLDGNFKFLPYQPREHLADSLAAADVHLATLLPELEGLIVPSKFYGILAAGRATVFVGHAEGELARVIRANCCGDVVAAGDGQGLAGVLRELRDDPAARLEMGRRAADLHRRRYTADAASERWLGLILDLPQNEITVPAATSAGTLTAASAQPMDGVARA
jgi:colanic acid biosynthesis glycosyl transferase WcaI